MTTMKNLGGQFPDQGNRPLTCLNWWAILGLNQ
jgi:hypothetical protein